jgi:uncharacterized protein YecE (DUF72 family)
MDFYVGTSGWAYNWNKTRRLDWFVAESGLNSVELNATFYRYPSSKTVATWATKGRNLRWSIKVNRLFTHTYKFNTAALARWSNFKQLFDQMDSLIDFYLFQLPPHVTPHTAPQIKWFTEKADLDGRFALEIRNTQWFTPEWVNWAKDLGITLVSVDAPDLPRDVFGNTGQVYVRMHGRTSWYSHKYTNKELEEVVAKILTANPTRAFVFFNNDTAMLENARFMLKLVKEK